ncbi:oxygenase MpaB family protein [Nocardia sp. NPDC005825]|uniref:oxygenase MpaB family protein n=1 Tax=unclassified Nocardia TaxID=2637762 RepID=UPI0033D78007
MTHTDPATPVDPLGPDSLLWKYLGDARAMLFIGRSGTLQSMHPAVNAALQQHSTFFDNPWDRLLRSIPQVLGMIYDADAREETERVRDYHKPLKGIDEHGRRYHALDPEVFWWTHATFVETCVALNDYFGTPLTDTEKDQLIAEGAAWWRRYGLSERVVIDNYADFQRYWDRTIDEVLESNATTDYVTTLRHTKIPPLTGIPQPVWDLIWRPVMTANVWLANGLMPTRCRDTLGWQWTRTDQALLAALATTIRTIWPILPQRLRYHPRAYAGIRRTRHESATPAGVHAHTAA